MRDERRSIWFPAKRYGWGWGTPATWQGWLVLAGFILLSLGGARVLLSPPRTASSIVVFLAFMLLLSLAMIGICRMKGERPKWRWGGK